MKFKAFNCSIQYVRCGLKALFWIGPTPWSTNYELWFNTGPQHTHEYKVLLEQLMHYA